MSDSDHSQKDESEDAEEAEEVWEWRHFEYCDIYEAGPTTSTKSPIGYCWIRRLDAPIQDRHGVTGYDLGVSQTFAIYRTHDDTGGNPSDDFGSDGFVSWQEGCPDVEPTEPGPSSRSTSSGRSSRSSYGSSRSYSSSDGDSGRSSWSGSSESSDSDRLFFLPGAFDKPGIFELVCESDNTMLDDVDHFGLGETAIPPSPNDMNSREKSLCLTGIAVTSCESCRMAENPASPGSDSRLNINWSPSAESETTISEPHIDKQESGLAFHNAKNVDFFRISNEKFGDGDAQPNTSITMLGSCFAPETDENFIRTVSNIDHIEAASDCAVDMSEKQRSTEEYSRNESVNQLPAMSHPTDAYQPIAIPPICALTAQDLIDLRRATELFRSARSLNSHKIESKSVFTFSSPSKTPDGELHPPTEIAGVENQHNFSDSFINSGINNSSQAVVFPSSLKTTPWKGKFVSRLTRSAPTLLCQDSNDADSLEASNDDDDHVTDSDTEIECENVGSDSEFKISNAIITETFKQEATLPSISCGTDIDSEKESTYTEERVLNYDQTSVSSSQTSESCNGVKTNNLLDNLEAIAENRNHDEWIKKQRESNCAFTSYRDTNNDYELDTESDIISIGMNESFNDNSIADDSSSDFRDDDHVTDSAVEIESKDTESRFESTVCNGILTKTLKQEASLPSISCEADLDSKGEFAYSEWAEPVMAQGVLSLERTSDSSLQTFESLNGEKIKDLLQNLQPVQNLQEWLEKQRENNFAFTSYRDCHKDFHELDTESDVISIGIGKTFNVNSIANDSLCDSRNDHRSMTENCCPSEAFSINSKVKLPKTLSSGIFNDHSKQEETEHGHHSTLESIFVASDKFDSPIDTMAVETDFVKTVMSESEANIKNSQTAENLEPILHEAELVTLDTASVDMNNIKQNISFNHNSDTISSNSVYEISVCKTKDATNSCELLNDRMTLRSSSEDHRLSLGKNGKDIKLSIENAVKSADNTERNENEELLDSNTSESACSISADKVFECGTSNDIKTNGLIEGDLAMSLVSSDDRALRAYSLLSQDITERSDSSMNSTDIKSAILFHSDETPTDEDLEISDVRKMIELVGLSIFPGEDIVLEENNRESDGEFSRAHKSVNVTRSVAFISKSDRLEVPMEDDKERENITEEMPYNIKPLAAENEEPHGTKGVTLSSPTITSASKKTALSSVLLPYNLRSSRYAVVVQQTLPSSAIPFSHKRKLGEGDATATSTEKRRSGTKAPKVAESAAIGNRMAAATAAEEQPASANVSNPGSTTTMMLRSICKSGPTKTCVLTPIVEKRKLEQDERSLMAGIKRLKAEDMPQEAQKTSLLQKETESATVAEPAVDAASGTGAAMEQRSRELTINSMTQKAAKSKKKGVMVLHPRNESGKA